MKIVPREAPPDELLDELVDELLDDDAPPVKLALGSGMKTTLSTVRISSPIVCLLP